MNVYSVATLYTQPKRSDTDTWSSPSICVRYDQHDHVFLMVRFLDEVEGMGAFPRTQKTTPMTRATVTD